MVFASKRFITVLTIALLFGTLAFAQQTPPAEEQRPTTPPAEHDTRQDVQPPPPSDNAQTETPQEELYPPPQQNLPTQLPESSDMHTQAPDVAQDTIVVDADLPAPTSDTETTTASEAASHTQTPDTTEETVHDHAPSSPALSTPPSDKDTKDFQKDSSSLHVTAPDTAAQPDHTQPDVDIPHTSPSAGGVVSTTLEPHTTPPPTPEAQQDVPRARASIHIKEIQIAAESSADDIMRLVNDGSQEVSLKGWSVRRCPKNGIDKKDCTQKAGTISIITTPLRSITLKKDESYIWKNTKTSGKLTANTSIALFDDHDRIIDTLTWGAPPFAFVGSPHVANPTNCQKIIWDATTDTFIITHQERPACLPIEYHGEKLLINELYPFPIDPNTQDEFIEIYNPQTSVVSLRGWKITDASKTGTHTFHKTDDVIPGLGYVVIMKKTLSFALNNSGTETITLIAPNASIVDTLSYTDAKKGFSYSRDNTTWHWTPLRTPGKKNAFLTSRQYPRIILSEILPNPQGDEKEAEFIELYNPTENDVALKYWTLSDSSATGTYTWTDDTIIKAHDYLAIYRPEFHFALNNSGQERVTLTAPNGIVTSTLTYHHAHEGIAYGWTGTRWRWTPTPTPRKKNVFGVELLIHAIKIHRAYKNVPTTFAVRTSYQGDTIKYRWDFGDGHYSTKKNARHTYKKTGTYHGSVYVRSAIETATKTFTLAVKTFPKYDIDIVEISPNPVGKDLGNEYIRIINNEKKKVRLSHWSIATGKDADHLVNHPFRKKLKLAKGKSKKIRSVYAAISLPNKGGVVELRAPDGRVVNRVTYTYNRGTTIPSGSRYYKTSNGWLWDIPVQQKKKHANRVLPVVDARAIISDARINDARRRTHRAQPQEQRVHNYPELQQSHQTLLERLSYALNAFLVSIMSHHPQHTTPSLHANHHVISFATLTPQSPCQIKVLFYNTSTVPLCLASRE